MEVEAVDEGTLGKILVPEGTADVAVNTPIAVILGDGEDKSAIKDAKPAPSRRQRRRRAEAPKPNAQETPAAKARRNSARRAAKPKPPPIPTFPPAPRWSP